MNHRSLLLGHRGWSAKYPENTMISFAGALDYGLDGLEFDVQLTADGVPVIIHDETLNRTTDGIGKVSDWTYSKLVDVNAAAKWPQFDRAPIPTLVSVLGEAYKRKPTGLYNIEIKVYNEGWRELVDRVLSIVNTHPLANNVVFSSFHFGCLEYLRHQSPKAKIGLLYEERVEEPWSYAQDVGAYSVNLNHKLTSRDVIFGCHEHDTRVSVWTVDEPMELEKFFSWGTDIVISNVADVAKVARDTDGQKDEFKCLNQ